MTAGNSRRSLIAAARAVCAAFSLTLVFAGCGEKDAQPPAARQQQQQQERAARQQQQDRGRQQRER